MWDTSEESSGTMEGGPPEAVVHTKGTCEQNKNQLESLKEIMIKNQESLKKKEEEVQEYARRLSKIKSRAKFSRRSKEGASSSKDAAHKAEFTAKNITDDAIDDVSQAKTSKAKSSLLQRKLAENRKAFEQRSKELTETKRAVEEKVEAIRQQLEETDLAAAEHKDQLVITPIKPLMISSEVMSPIQIQDFQENEKKIMEFNSKIINLEATILDLQENLKEKDSVIDSKTKAITLMSADLSKKGKTTLDTLEDTKDEMRIMQENFVLLETSLKNKNASLLEQLQERDNKISELEQTIDRFEEQLKEQKMTESANVDFSRSTMDTLAETKDVMKSMQENFILIESSLKLKNDNLLQQLEEYEIKMAEAKERIFQLESGAGIAITPAIEDLQFKIQKLEHSNRQLLDEKYELQKGIAELQDKIITSKSVHDNDAVIERDNRIKQLENLVEELKRSNELLIEESKIELQKRIAEMSFKNEEYSSKITDLEKQIYELETEKSNTAKLSDDRAVPKKDETVTKLTKELDELNKSMIKLRAQHRSKVKNMQKQLENFKKVSDTNAELVRLGNQVALLEEEKGNLQLSLVDFDELKASAGDWQERVADLENKVSSQTKEIQAHVDAIAILENQKLDLMQDLHAVKQEVLSLEAENAESENLRVTAEMKVVELEEQLEAVHKEQSENKLESLSESEYHELIKKIDTLTQENSELYAKLSKLEEKGTSDTGSTESFENIQMNDKNDLLKKIEDLEQKNNELMLKLTKMEEKDGSHAGSTESFETINDTDRSELLKKIEQLTQENSDLTIKLSRIEEKGSSDTGSTESFERIPEHNDNTTKIELLTQENSELVIKLTKLEEHLSQIESTARLNVSKTDSSLEALKDNKLQIETLRQENDNLMTEIFKLRTQIGNITEDNSRLENDIERLTATNTELIINRTELEERLEAELSRASQMSVQIRKSSDQISVLTERQQVLEKELIQMREASVEQSINVTSCETDDAKSKIATLEKENAQMIITIAQLEECIKNKEKELNKTIREKEGLSIKLEQIVCDDFSRERSELIDKLEKLNQEKNNIVKEKQELHEQISTLLQRSSDEILEMRKTEDIIYQESQTAIVASLEKELENSKVLVTEYKNQIEEMNIKLQSMEAQLQKKSDQLVEYEVSGVKLESLENELKDMFVTAEEWKFKYDDMQVKMQALEQGKALIEEAFKTLENGNKELLEVIKEKDAATLTLQDTLQTTIDMLEIKLQNEITAKEHEIVKLKTEITDREQELHTKYAQLQNSMITIDSLQDELDNYSIKLKENQVSLSSTLEEITKLNDVIKEKEEEIHILKNDIGEVLEQSKPLAEFNEILKSLQNKETSYIELHNKYDDVIQENSELLQKIENISKDDENVKNDLRKKEQEIDDLLMVKTDLDKQIQEIKNEKNGAEKRIWELQTILDNQTKYVEEIQSELTNEYKQIERLKAKHVEDIAMLNHRLENVIEELNVKMQENETMKTELEQKEEMLSKNVTEEMKTTLEEKLVDLEQKLSETENKLQMQSEKMKKIVATFNKKKVACQELEARVAELEEKWTTEKDEKEVKNKQIQEVENSMREKDNKIADLEEKLLHANNSNTEALTNLEKVTKESNSLKEKMSVLMEHNTEMGEEIEKQRVEIEHISLEITKEKTVKEDIAKEYEVYKQTVSKENEQKQMILDDVKEEARELNVRMQVMETEYVEQLAMIKNLHAENGLLLSKQTQINEKLENTEKESEERRVLIEQLQKELTDMANKAISIQVANQNVREDDTRIVQHCEHSEQCQNLVQALEARLQERQAEIENLNNELANSYGNIVLLHDESLRYNDMMMQTAQERFNQSLMYRTNALQQEIDSLKTEKNISDQKVSELETELEEYKRKNAECTVEIPVTSIIESEQQTTQDSNVSQPLDTMRTFDTNITLDVKTLDKTEIKQLQNLLTEKESQCSEHVREIDSLLKNVEEKKVYIQKLENQFKDSQDELMRINHLLSEKNMQINSLKMELDKMILQMNELKALQEKYSIIKTESQRSQQLLIEKNMQIDSLIAELNTVNQQTNMQEHTNIEADMRSEISLKNIESSAMRTELVFAKGITETLTTEQDRILKSSQIDNSKAETRNINDTDLIQEWQQHISTIITERDLLQLQVNDLTRSLEELKESLSAQSNLQIELENALQEKDQAQLLLANLTRASENLQENVSKSKISEDSLKKPVSFEETNIRQELEQVGVVDEPIGQKYVQSIQSSVEKEIQQDIHLDIGPGWDDSTEKVNLDEESWGWNAEDVQLIDDQHLNTMTLIPNIEVQLRAQMEDLQDKIKELEAQNVKITEESKAAQVKSGKLVKKLKEYKMQIESLQQQLKTQKQADSFFDLDTAIEEELKTQIANLEKALKDSKEEHKNIIMEKETLLKRLDVIMSANERYMEMKERQDMEIEVLRIQNKELDNKIQSVQWELQAMEIRRNISSLQFEDQIDPSINYEAKEDKPIARDQPQKRSVQSTDDFEVMSKKYKEEMDDLKDELEALAAENEQLQHFLEQQKTTISNLELKNSHNTDELMEKLNILNNQNEQLQSVLNKNKEEYDVLRKQYEQSLIDANDQVAVMRQNGDLLKIEFTEKIDKLELEIDNLQKAVQEKDILQDKLNILMNSEEKLSIGNTSLTEVTELLNARVQEVADLKQELQIQYVERQQAEEVLQLEMQDLVKELDKSKQEIGTLRQACIDKEHEMIQETDNLMETVNTVISEATQELVQRHAIEIEEKDKELRILTEKLMALQSTIDEYISKLQESASKLEMQQQQITYLKEDLIERNSIIEAIQADVKSTTEKLREKEQELIQYDKEKMILTAEIETHLANIQHLHSQLNTTKASTEIDLQECNSRICNMEEEIQVLKSERDSILMQYNQEMKTHQAHLDSDKEQLNILKHDLQEKTEQLHYVNTQLCVKENDLEEIKARLTDKDSLLEITSQELNEKQIELERLHNQQLQTVDDSSTFRISNDDAELQNSIDELKAQMEVKQQELEHLKNVLSENTYPTIIQQMQDRINCLYNEKATLETSLHTTVQTLTEKQEQMNLLIQRINVQEQVSKEEVNLFSRERRSMHDQEEIVRLQNELHIKEQEINELRYIIAEKDSQLCLQASMEPQSDDFELRESVQRLTGELYGKEQEVQVLKSIIEEKDTLYSQNFEKLSEENKDAIKKLTSEKEQIRVEAEEFLSRELQKKESEIDEIKQTMSEENQKLLTELQLRNNDIEKLKNELGLSHVLIDERGNKLQQKENELMHTMDELAEKERKLAELSITKDTELHNLKVQIREKEARIEEVVTLSIEEEKQLNELRQTLITTETEVNRLKALLEQKVSEYELIQHALKKNISVSEDVVSKISETVQTTENKEITSRELDLALYMLHQRDVRCEELTHELMQLLEERDTLQLRLSNAIRVNEELRRVGSAEASPIKESTSISQTMIEPIVEQPSPSKSEGPVEIAKEAIDAPIEDKETLALKLSQLHSVSHAKDVRLKDERELRHTQQMSLLAHKDVLSTLPPEAAARLVNANYTLSRDVQSQSSVLLNWLWGKSTPKVVHM